MKSKVRDVDTVHADFEARYRAAQEDNSRLEGRVRALEQELQQLRQQYMPPGVKRQLKELYGTVDAAVQRRLHERGYQNTQPLRVKLPPEVLSSAHIPELRRAAFVYDVQAYFSTIPGRSGMKLHYRLADKAYRLSRNAIVWSLKKVYRMARKGRTT